MNNGHKPATPWLPPDFFRNQERRAPEELFPYAGKFIAWSKDGAAILASGDTRQQVKEQLLAQGLDTSAVVWDYVDPPEHAITGGAETDA